MAHCELHEHVRIDKWLWAARFFKTRALAQAAVVAGKVRLHDERIKPSKDIRAGDALAIRVGEFEWNVTAVRRMKRASFIARAKRASRGESRRSPTAKLSAGRPASAKAARRKESGGRSSGFGRAAKTESISHR